jgi:hypothetical protein
MSATRGNRWGWALISCAMLLTAISYLASVNEYAEVFGRELAGAYDCDGPAIVVLLSAPAVILSGAGMFLSFRAFCVTRDRRALLAVFLGVAVLCVIAFRAPAVAAELAKNARADSPCR